MYFLRQILAYVLVFGVVDVVLAQQSEYQQCGGIGWTGATTCVSPYTCQVINSYYYQCLPSSSSATTASTTTSSKSSVTSSASSTSASSTSTSTTLNVSPAWATAYVKAEAALSKMSLQDKVNVVTGIGWMNGNCVGNTPPVSSINYPGLCLEDSPLGVRYADYVSAFPAGITVASTWNRTLMYNRGVALGQEFRGKGVNVALGPMMNIMRAPAAGRNWEGFGGDPYLSGEGAYQTITGIQSTGVQAVAKHYINNEQEHYRTSSSSNVDDRTQHEIYLYPFMRSVQANVASVMCSYNQINGTFACSNSGTLNGLMKGELGFQGYIMSDWQATHATSDAVAGLDMTMPGDETFGSGNSYFGSNLISAVNAGTVPQSRVDDMTRRILAAWYLLGQDSGYPAVNFDAWNLNAAVNTHVNVQGNHASLIRQIGAAGTVLLKNNNNALPLKKPKSIGVIGNGAGNSSLGPNGYTDRGGDDGVLAMGWGSGTDNFPYLVAPVDAITSRASQDGTTVTSSLSDTDLTGATNAAKGKSVAFVFITADSGEGYITVEGNAGDRNNLNAWHSGDALVEQVAAANNNTIVVVNSVGPIVMENWIENPNVTAVVWSNLPGQEAGNSLVDVIYGAYNPSGRLPYTIGKSISDYSAQVIYSSSASIVPINYSEGIFVDYRHFDQAGITPRFEFGYGLSYTTFHYSNLSVSGSTSGGTYPLGPGSSLDPYLHDTVVTVSFTLTNNGTIAGTEIPQLYTSPPASANAAPFNLHGFDSIYLAPGASQTVTFSLSRLDFSIWDVVHQKWSIPSGSTGISVGASSRDIRLTGSIVN